MGKKTAWKTTGIDVDKIKVSSVEMVVIELPDRIVHHNIGTLSAFVYLLKDEMQIFLDCFSS